MDLNADLKVAEARLRELDAGPREAPERIRALNELAWSLRQIDLDRAIQLADEALELAERRQDPSGLAWALRNRAFFAMPLSELQPSMQMAHRAYDIFEELGDGHGRAWVSDLLATQYEFVGRFSEAMDCALRALEQFREIGDRRGMGWALSSAGGILAASGDEPGALARLEEGLALFEELDYPPGVCRLCIRLGKLHLDYGRPEAARLYFERLVRESNRTQGMMFRAGALSLLGEVHEALGELERARELFEQGVAEIPDRVRRGFGVMATINLGRVLLKLGELEQARDRLHRDLEVAQTGGAVPIERQVRGLLADLYEQLGEPRAALEHLRAYHDLREREFDAETRNKLKNLEVSLGVEAARKDAEIHRLRYVELESMQAQLVEAEKMAVLGNLAAGVAHELNSPLGVIQSNLHLSERALERLEGTLGGERVEVRALLDALGTARRTTAEALERISGIVGSLKRFAHLDQAEQQHVDVVENLESVLRLLQPTLPEPVRVERNLDPVPRVWGSAGQLNQVFLTLLTNAVEAIDGEGRVSIRTSEENGDVVICFGDTGRGIPAEQVAGLFDGGFVAKQARMRFGLGLPAANATVRKHGGRIDVESRVGVGSTFTVRLPAHDPT